MNDIFESVVDVGSLYTNVLIQLLIFLLFDLHLKKDSMISH